MLGGSDVVVLPPHQKAAFRLGAEVAALHAVLAVVARPEPH